VPRAVTVSPSEVIGPSGADQAFPGAYRLRKTDEYSSVFAFRRSHRGRFLTVHYRPNGLTGARLGVVVGKRLARRAKVRNLVKRIVREQFRRNRASLKAFDLVVRLHAPVDLATRAMINDDMVQLLDCLRR
jgi:ribonuclease P protein component